MTALLVLGCVLAYLAVGALYARSQALPCQQGYGEILDERPAPPGVQ